MKKIKTNKKYARNILSIIFENGVSSDQITLIGGLDDQRVLIHRNVLMACSKYFTAALGPNFNENGGTEFVFDETDGTMLKAIVDFCYTGLIDLTEENVLKFLAVSDSVELDLLNGKCRRFVYKKMNRSNVLKIFTVADKYNYLVLRKEALKLIAKSFGELPASELIELDWRSLQTILKNNINLHVPQNLVFNRLVEWFRQDETAREQQMVELLKLIRLEFMPSQFLMDEQLETIFRQFNRFESILAERRSRETVGMEDSNDDPNQSRPIISLCMAENDNSLYIERYNSESNTFEDIGTLNIGERRSYEVQLYENKVYVMGGTNKAGRLKSVSRFDVITGEEEILPEMNEAREKFTSISLGKYIYVFGGWGQKNYADESSDSERLNFDIGFNSGYSKSCERFDMEIMTWTVLEPMNIARSGARAIALNGHVYILGGIRYYYVPELYDPKNDEWHRLATLSNYYKPLTPFSSNSFLHVHDTSTSRIMHRYDTSANCWTQVEHNITQQLTSSVATIDGIFAITGDGDFGKINLGANGIWSFELLSKSRGNLLYLS